MSIVLSEGARELVITVFLPLMLSGGPSGGGAEGVAALSGTGPAGDGRSTLPPLPGPLLAGVPSTRVHESAVWPDGGAQGNCDQPL